MRAGALGLWKVSWRSSGLRIVWRWPQGKDSGGLAERMKRHVFFPQEICQIDSLGHQCNSIIFFFWCTLTSRCSNALYFRPCPSTSFLPTERGKKRSLSKLANPCLCARCSSSWRLCLLLTPFFMPLSKTRPLQCKGGGT